MKVFSHAVYLKLSVSNKSQLLDLWYFEDDLLSEKMKWCEFLNILNQWSSSKLQQRCQHLWSAVAFMLFDPLLWSCMKGRLTLSTWPLNCECTSQWKSNGEYFAFSIVAYVSHEVFFIFIKVLSDFCGVPLAEILFFIYFLNCCNIINTMKLTCPTKNTKVFVVKLCELQFSPDFGPQVLLKPDMWQWTIKLKVLWLSCQSICI